MSRDQTSYCVVGLTQLAQLKQAYETGYPSSKDSSAEQGQVSCKSRYLTGIVLLLTKALLARRSFDVGLCFPPDHHI